MCEGECEGRYVRVCKVDVCGVKDVLGERAQKMFQDFLEE